MTEKRRRIDASTEQKSRALDNARILDLVARFQTYMGVSKFKTVSPAWQNVGTRIPLVSHFADDMKLVSETKEHKSATRRLVQLRLGPADTQLHLIWSECSRVVQHVTVDDCAAFWESKHGMDQKSGWPYLSTFHVVAGGIARDTLAILEARYETLRDVLLGFCAEWTTADLDRLSAIPWHKFATVRLYAVSRKVKLPSRWVPRSTFARKRLGDDDKSLEFEILADSCSVKHRAWVLTFDTGSVLDILSPDKYGGDWPFLFYTPGRVDKEKITRLPSKLHPFFRQMMINLGVGDPDSTPLSRWLREQPYKGLSFEGILSYVTLDYTTVWKYSALSDADLAAAVEEKISAAASTAKLLTLFRSDAKQSRPLPVGSWLFEGQGTMEKDLVGLKLHAGQVIERGRVTSTTWNPLIAATFTENSDSVLLAYHVADEHVRAISLVMIGGMYSEQEVLLQNHVTLRVRQVDKRRVPAFRRDRDLGRVKGNYWYVTGWRDMTVILVDIFGRTPSADVQVPARLDWYPTFEIKRFKSLDWQPLPGEIAWSDDMTRLGFCVQDDRFGEVGQYEHFHKPGVEDVELRSFRALSAIMIGDGDFNSPNIVAQGSWLYGISDEEHSDGVFVAEIHLAALVLAAKATDRAVIVCAYQMTSEYRTWESGTSTTTEFGGVRINIPVITLDRHRPTRLMRKIAFDVAIIHACIGRAKEERAELDPSQQKMVTDNELVYQAGIAAAGKLFKQVKGETPL